MTLSLGQARAVLDGVFAKAKQLGLHPLAAAVVDAGGHILAARRQDGAAMFRPEVAVAKAAGALSIGMSTRALAELAAERPAFVAALSAIAPRGLVPSPGGVIILGDDGAPLGAVAVSGDTGDNDEACALAGVAAAGLRTQ